MSASPRTDLRPTRAAQIVAAGDIHESRPGLWRVRDVAGSGTWHYTSPTSCDCQDFRRTGLQCKHVLALKEYQKAQAGPVCPTCGAATRAQRYYVAGTYRWFADCVRNPEHQAQKLS